MDNNKADQIIDGIIEGLRSLKEVLKEPPPSALASHINNQLSIQSFQSNSDLDNIKKALWSDKWPEAVNANLICDPSSEFDKTERARGIFELMIEQNISKKKFLDYGCGEGHVSKISLDYSPALSVGYDIRKQWPDIPGCLMTDSINVLQENKPYDIILLFDVIDHIEGEHPIDLLARAKALLADDGRIYMRSHPFTSRHATHSYHTLNKAYVHLVFNKSELADLTSDVTPNFGVIDPQTYLSWFQSLGLKIVSRKNIHDRIEPFFKIPKIASRINQQLGTKDFPESLGVQFIDWCLSK